MKKFVELIQRMYQERYPVVINRIVSEKIPVAFLSVEPLNNVIAIVNNLRGQGINITNLITTTPPLQELKLDFEVIHIQNINRLHPKPEYIFTADGTSSRFANKYTSGYTILCPLINSDYHYSFFMEHLNEFQEFYESLIDEESRKTFYGYWFVRVSNQFGTLHHANTTQYIAAGFIPERGAVVIDCGVCDGGTSAKFAGMGYKVYGFEMDRKNFELAKELATEKGFIVENLGLGSYNHEMRYTHDENNIGGSKLDVNGSEITQIITLDSYVAEKNLTSVDFIKMDVEGAELDILKGATTTIARYKPILALSAYHKLDDFFTLRNFVKSIRPDYEFALRHYASSREDNLYGFSAAEEDRLYNLGLDPTHKGAIECVLLAR